MSFLSKFFNSSSINNDSIEKSAQLELMGNRTKFLNDAEKLNKLIENLLLDKNVNQSNSDITSLMNKNRISYYAYAGDQLKLKDNNLTFKPFEDTDWYHQSWSTKQDELLYDIRTHELEIRLSEVDQQLTLEDITEDEAKILARVYMKRLDIKQYSGLCLYNFELTGDCLKVIHQDTLL